MREGLPNADELGGGPLIVTEDAHLLDDLLRLCAAAGAMPEVHHGPPAERGSWERAPMVLVGDDAAPRCRGAARRRGVMLVGRDQDDPDVWRRAVEIGAEYVLRLPDAEGWLVDQIANAAEGVGRPALTVGVMGGRGGSGASTLACALAVTAARSGRRTMLIDGDPLGGGIDVLLGGEESEGMRWPDFARSKGRVGGGALEESLPALHGLRVLSWGRDDEVAVQPQAMQAVLAAARRRGGVVVVDLPRRIDDSVAEALAQLDAGLLVVPGELRAVAAAKRVAAAAGMVLRDLRVVARGPYSAGLDEHWVAEALGLPLVGDLPLEPGLAADQNGGEPPGGDPRGPLARFCDGFWELADVSDGVGGGIGAASGTGGP
ncbi:MULTISPECIES: septum site-determining protein Ssd [unclassified Streptomyces]|uniref:septum site-determining protein Ssd n=1 Tax=unclassified Streptomyces TaxID=2593676 RepID=UPI0001C19DD7|nr:MULTISPECIES: septum site-determining protein Ssd [unclassified Streptomyces]AEN10874.1 putative septum site-determining protein [Streptomyces sp. SirexAA-E]MYR69275.1 septum formation initiator [Streptomyces sp. SID4939]MYT63859.1 septum formation initiator [Streptomyces sp. SID8357]MYT86109.1 septum formation initiator [Streptomyces sp. SID8360]MYW38340.1 septum formation initiator [Streptomyces sp. SID1]